MTADDAIKLVRRCRKGAVQTARQVEFCRTFEKYILDLQRTYVTPGDGLPLVEFGDFMNRQQLLLNGEPARALRYVPRHIFHCLSQVITLTELAAARVRSTALIALKRQALHSDTYRHRMLSAWRHMNHGSFDANRIGDAPLLLHLVTEWFWSLGSPMLAAETVKALVDAVDSNPTDTTPVHAVVEALPRAVRHTVGTVLSALAVLTRGLPTSVSDGAIAATAVALAQGAAPENRESSTLASLTHALSIWADAVGDGYWDPDTAPKSRRVVRMMAEYGNIVAADGVAAEAVGVVQS